MILRADLQHYGNDTKLNKKLGRYWFVYVRSLGGNYVSVLDLQSEEVAISNFGLPMLNRHGSIDSRNLRIG